MRVLKVTHSGVIRAWRERERSLRRRGVDITMLTAAVWNEGGRPVAFEPGDDQFVTPIRTWGRHPNVFVFDPRPLWRLLSSQWDVIDVHEEPCSLAAAEMLLLRWFRRATAPVVLYSAQNITKRYPPPFRWTEQWALRTTSAVSVCNSAAGRILRAKGLKGVVAQVPLGVDLEEFSPRDRNPPMSGELRIGYVGQLAAHKGVSILLHGLTGGPMYHLEVVGAGPTEGGLREEAATLGIKGQVNFSGPADQADLPARYRSFDAVVVPSLPTPGWEEQFCRVALEAMACGTPVIASRSGALPEVVGTAGILVEPGDPTALRAALDELATNPPLWKDLREAGLTRACCCSWKSVARRYLDLYLTVVGKPPVDRGARAPTDTGWPPAPKDDGHPRGDLPPLEVIVVAYGDSDALQGCVAELEGRFPVVIVDNSRSAAARSVAGQHGARYLDPGRNVGFAAGVNYALSHRPPGVDVLLLNPDARISPFAAIELHKRLLMDDSLACVAPSQIHPADGAPVRVGWPFPTPVGAWLEAVGLGRMRDRSQFVIGSVLLMRAAAIDDVGPLDERFFLYAEETDWQIRARRHGWRVAICPDVSATHVGAGSGGDMLVREIHFHASQERLIRKHHGILGWQVYRAGCILGAAARGLLLGGERRRAALQRLVMYLEGPCRREKALGREPVLPDRAPGDLG